MLATVCLFLCVVSVHSYDVKVTVSEFCLDIYKVGYDGAELYMDLSLTSASEFYVFMSRYSTKDSHTVAFTTTDNLLTHHRLLLDEPNQFSNILSLNDFDIVFTIDPIVVKIKDNIAVENCQKSAVHRHTISPGILFKKDDATTTTSFAVDLTSNNCFAKNACQHPTISITVVFDCDGACDKLLATTTAPSTYSPTTQMTADPATSTSSMTPTTRSVSATTHQQGTTRITPTSHKTPELTTTIESSPPGGNKSTGGMIAIGILAAIELLIILGMCLWFFKKYKPGLLKRSARAVRDVTESDSVTYANPRNQSANTAAPVNGTPREPPAPNADYADVDEAAEYTAIAKKAQAAPSSDYADVDETGEYTAIAKKAHVASSSDYADVDETGEYTAIVKPAPRKPKKEAKDPKVAANDVVDKSQFANNEMYD